MNSDQWRRVENLYHAALERDLDARVSFLTDTCSDEQVRLEVAALLKYDSQAKSFMETPAFKQTARALAAESELEANTIVPSDVGPHHLLAPIGQGGMGQVYLALDTRLNRKVAIKLLPSALSSDPDRARRFKQEARAASSLSHPNIVTVFEVGEANGRAFIVSEFVEGQTLRDRLTANSNEGLDIQEALNIGAQVAKALEAAHLAGVIHRDIKPENVMIRKDGLVKVLDFGLAKINADDFPDSTSQSQQLLTRTGVVMGTAAYMSPEQARGQQIDHRADIFSFGALLYEAVSGTRPFTGETTSDVIAAVLIKDPEPIAKVAPGVSPLVAAVVTRCLEKKPDQRFQSAADLAFTLQDLGKLTENAGPRLNGSTVQRYAQTLRSHMVSSPKSWIAALIVLAVLVTIAMTAYWQFSAVNYGPTVGFSFQLPEDWGFREFDVPMVSPDGKMIAFTALPTNDGAGTESALWIHRLDSSGSTRLSATDGASAPFWSPDSRYLAFRQQNRLNRIDVQSGAITPLLDTGTLGENIKFDDAGSPGTWGTGEVILVPIGSRLMRLSTTGGAPLPVDRFADSESGQVNPQFLPDGRRFLYYSRNQNRQDDGIYISSLDTPKARKLVMKGANAATFVTGGYLLLSRDLQLLAQRFDLSSQTVIGDPTLLTGPSNGGAKGLMSPAAFSASNNGVLIWRANDPSAGPSGGNLLTWYDASGRRLSTTDVAGNYSGPALSPNQEYLVVSRSEPGSNQRDLWLMNLVNGTSTQFTSDPADELNPSWSPDGKWIYFTIARDGKRRIHRKLAIGLGATEPQAEFSQEDNVEDLSPNGRFIVFNSRTQNDDVPDLTLVPLNGGRRIKFAETSGREDQAQFSPDGRWLAYHWEDSGRSKIIVRAVLPDGRPGSAVWELAQSGNQPRWSADGKKLFYLDAEKLMAIDINTTDDTISGSSAKRLFGVKIDGNQRRNRYLVARDGRFLVVSVTEPITGSTVSGQINWPAVLNN
jgi:eukaryotic-like serine/threonine-protein kinase